jgi:hypothetical protein
MKYITIIVFGGLIDSVKGLPKNYGYKVIDKDNKGRG